MAGLFSQQLLAVAQKKPWLLYVLLDLQLPGGTRRYSKGPLKTPFGQYHGKIISMGSFYRGCSTSDGRLSYPRLGNIIVEDMDHELAAAFELNDPAGSPVTVWIAADGLHQDFWFRFVDNFVLDDCQQDDLFRWILSFSYNDLPLRSLIPRTPILRPDFPKVADPVTYNYHVQIAYGVHDSSGVGDKGMVPTYYVDTDLGRFGAWLGWVEVPRVFLNEVLQTSGYSIVHPIIGGRQYTLIQFDTPPDPTTNPQVTADIIGYKDGPAGTGDLLTGASALQHWLVNFVYPTEDWKQGEWFSSSTAPVHEAYFSGMQGFLVEQSWDAVSRQYGGNKRIVAADGVREWCDSFGDVGVIGAFVTNDGKIALRPNNWKTLVLAYPDNQWIRFARDQVGPKSFRRRTDRHGLLDRINAQFLMRTADDSFRWSIEVADLSVGRNAAGDLRMPWSNAQLD